ncbi:DJ-1/PfpI family protein [Nostoc sp.]|uniref:DJ-1/PfpI family protein n=1 Tax=Nostoc sp. TaxID=1180 RepID=UPI002FF8907D
MIPRSLGGKKIAILLESEFIPEEIEAYQKRFSELQATVHLMSRLWNQPSVRFFSDEDTGNTPRTIDVNIDFQNVDINDYAAVIMTANYTSVRLRYFEPPVGQPISAEQVRTSPAVQFYAKAMANPRIIKGALCHGLWILTPMPELLKDRQVICHEVVLADIINAGAVYTTSPTGVVVDGDLVTGRSKHEVEPFIDAITEQIQQLSVATNRFSSRRPTTSVSRLRVAS